VQLDAESVRRRLEIEGPLRLPDVDIGEARVELVDARLEEADEAELVRPGAYLPPLQLGGGGDER